MSSSFNKHYSHHPFLMHSRLPKARVSTIQTQQFSTGKPNGNRPKINPSRLGGLGDLSSFAFLSLTKSKSILAALKLTKFASLGSMLVTVGAYTTIYGLPYATGMVGLILVHESGHALVMRKLQIPFSPMIFVPFMGAAIAVFKEHRCFNINYFLGT